MAAAARIEEPCEVAVEGILVAVRSDTIVEGDGATTERVTIEIDAGPCGSMFVPVDGSAAAIDDLRGERVRLGLRMPTRTDGVRLRGTIASVVQAHGVFDRVTLRSPRGLTLLQFPIRSVPTRLIAADVVEVFVERA